MTIVDCAVYEDGCRRAGELPLTDAGEAARCDDAFVWIGVFEPTEDEFDAVRREFDLHELAVEDAINAHQRPKVELYGNTLLMVLKTVRYIDESDDLETGEILLFINRDFVVTVRHGQSRLHDVRLEVENRPDLLRYGTGAVLYAIVDRIVDDYEPVVQAVEVDIQEVEHDMFSPERTNPAERIYAMEREVLDLHRAVTPLAPAIDKLARGELIHPELRTYFRDVHDHLLRADRPDRGLPRSALERAPGQPHAGDRAPERGHAQDLGVGGDPRRPDRRRRDLRHELHGHAGAAVAVRVSGGPDPDPMHLRLLVLALPALGLALAACGGGGDAAPDVPDTIKVSSPAFADGATIPTRFTCSGDGDLAAVALERRAG